MKWIIEYFIGRFWYELLCNGGLLNYVIFTVMCYVIFWWLVKRFENYCENNKKKPEVKAGADIIKSIRERNGIID
jgi:hypothetical protein